MPSQAQPSTAWPIEDRIIATMRLVLAASAMLIGTIAPLASERWVPAIYTAVTLYTGYSAVLYALARRGSPYLSSIRLWAHWADVAVYVLLVALSGGTGSVFFFFFFFAILVASVRWGFDSGLRVAAVSAILFSTVGYVTAPEAPDFELARFLLRPVFLLVLGYMMGYWGGFEITLKQRLALLNEVMQLSNPRFGVNRTLGHIIERLRDFYDVDACLLVTLDPDSGEYRLRRASRQEPGGAVYETPVPPEVGRQLLELPPEQVIMRNTQRWGPWKRGPRCHAFNMLTGAREDVPEMSVEALAATLDAETFLTVPMRHHGTLVGRLYLAAPRHSFHESDPAFVLQVVAQVTPVVENIRLLDRLASDAAEEERQRIVRDLHDTVIQSYVGLQLGLVTYREKLAAGGPDAIAWVERLIELTNLGIAQIRDYLRELQGTGEHEGSLASALRRFARKYTEATGIAVQLETAPDLQINDRLAAEVFQMVTEALNLIREHTEATETVVGLGRREGRLILRIANEGADGSLPATPPSLTERAAALGGRAYVEPQADGRTDVVVEIPL